LTNTARNYNMKVYSEAVIWSDCQMEANTGRTKGNYH